MLIAAVTEYISRAGDPPFGGVDARMMCLCHELSKRHEVHVFASRMEGDEAIERQGKVVVHRVGRPRSHVQRGDFASRLDFGRICAGEIERLDPDIIECSGFVAYPAGLKAKRALRKPTIVTVHEVWQGEWVRNMGIVNGVAGNLLERHYLKMPFDRFVAVSDFTKGKLVERMGIDPGNICVIKNGVDRAMFDSLGEEEKYPYPTIVTTCRLVPYKKVDLLIHAVALLRSKYPDIKLLIIGKGPEEISLRQLADRLGVSQNIEFLGRIPDMKDVARILKRSHVFALPSIVEGFGMVVIEAMAAGIPYVASDITPIREVTKGGLGGRLFKPLDVQELKEDLDLALDSGFIKDPRVQTLLDDYDWKNLAITYSEEARSLHDQWRYKNCLIRRLPASASILQRR